MPSRQNQSVTLAGGVVLVGQDPSGVPRTVAVDEDGQVLTVGSASAGSPGTFPVPAAAADGETNATAISRIATRLFSLNAAGTWDRLRAGVATVGAAVTGFANQIPWAFFHASPTTRGEGQGGPLQADASGSLRTVEQGAPQAENNTDALIFTSPRAIASTTGGWTHSASNSAAIGTAGVNLKSSAGRVRRISATNIGTTAGFYICLINKASNAVNGDNIVARRWVPPREATVTTDNSRDLDFGESGVVLSTGITICASTTAGTVTLIGANELHYAVDWL